MKRTIILRGTPIEYDIQKKNVKNVNIRIKSDLTVHVSAPFRVSQKDIDGILQGKADFILSALKKYEARAKSAEGFAKDSSVKDGVTIFGKLLPVTVIEGKKNKADITDVGILVTLKNTEDKTALQKSLNAALDYLLRERVTELCRKAYPDFEKYLPHFPEIKFRRMKSRWGSCNFRKHILTFNYHLVRAPLDCVEYVVYHEFTHFIHHDHQKGFYSELSRHVPDYKIKRKALQNVSIN